MGNIILLNAMQLFYVGLADLVKHFKLQTIISSEGNQLLPSQTWVTFALDYQPAF